MIKHLILLKNPRRDGCQRGHASMVYKLCYKNSSPRTGEGNNSNSDFENYQLAEELLEPIIRKLKK